MHGIMSKFKIDFFELAFLAEACIPPRPIARTMFWHRLIDSIYYILSKEERAKMFDWISKASSFDPEQEDCAWFVSRFNPANQWFVQTDRDGIVETHECFKHNDDFYIKRNVSVNKDFIVWVEEKPYTL